MAQGEVARFRQQQALQEQAAQQGMYGFAIVASHKNITARMERSADYLLKLLAEGKHEEVTLLMETPTWGLEEERVTCHTTTSGEHDQKKEPYTTTRGCER